ncbi:MAG: hypothetical protein AB7N76_30320 [Planctomycetota bacterium]
MEVLQLIALAVLAGAVFGRLFKALSKPEELQRPRTYRRREPRRQEEDGLEPNDEADR